MRLMAVQGLLAALCSAAPDVEVPMSNSPSVIAEQLKRAPPEKIAEMDKELGSEKHMPLTDFYHFYFTDKMMSQFDYTQDTELISRMFNDCDVDRSGDIDWKEYPSLDALLRENFEPAFYARQRKQSAEAEKKREDIVASRSARKNQVALPEQPVKKVEAPAAESRGERSAALAAAIAAQAQQASADLPTVI